MTETTRRQTDSPATRRNGTLQSCEPCRKAKLRCDHRRPICTRCSTKNIAVKCFYHPAPMTKRASASRASPVTGTGSGPGSTPSRLVGSQPSSGTSSPGSTLSGNRFHAVIEPSSTLPGYLGSTSYSAVLAEHENRSQTPFEVESDSTTVATPLRFLEPHRLQLGVDVLRLLYDSTIIDTITRKYYDRATLAVMPRVMMQSILTSIRRVFDSFNPRGDMGQQFRDFSNQVFQNSSRPLIIHGSMTVEEYLQSFSGRNSRWEALGNIFAISGVALISTPGNDPDLVRAVADSQPKEKLLGQLVEASGVCLSFCDQAASANELLGFCQYSDTMLSTQQYGDTSYRAWRRLGDLSATIYAAGLHQENSQTGDYPFFLRQWRKSCFSSAFHADISIATFVGRPPLMNYRYCTANPPLDLSDDVLVSGGDRLNRAISELDVAGWNTSGSRHRVTTVRIRFLLAIFREETLEMALGTYEHQDFVQRYNQITEKARATWESCPAHLRYDLQPQDSSFSFTLRQIYVNYLYTFFLLQRALVKHTNTGQEALFETSRQILSIIIQITAERDPMLDMSRHYAWIVLSYGLPSASLLLLELLHQNQTVGPHTIALPRAELIRNLSVFVSCLSWVARPDHGNYQACKQVEKKLSNILDQILDPQPVQGEIFTDVTSGLNTFLDGYTYSDWDFNSEFLHLPSRDGFPF